MVGKTFCFIAADVFLGLEAWLLLVVSSRHFCRAPKASFSLSSRPSALSPSSELSSSTI